MNAQTVVWLYTSELYRDGWIFEAHPGKEEEAGRYLESMLPGTTSLDLGAVSE